MRRLNPSLAIMAAFVFAASINTAQAGWWGNLWKRILGKPLPYHTVVVTSNYLESRLLAELIQNETSQPVILLPTGAEQKIYLLGTRKNQNRVMSKEEFRKTVEILNPKTVLFLGSERYAAETYKEQIRPVYPVTVVEHDDFVRVADAVGTMMKEKGIPKHYRKMLAKINSDGKVKPEPHTIWASSQNGKDVVEVPAPKRTASLFKHGKK